MVWGEFQEIVLAKSGHRQKAHETTGRAAPIIEEVATPESVINHPPIITS
jgi:hypothetical protein